SLLIPFSVAFMKLVKQQQRQQQPPGRVPFNQPQPFDMKFGPQLSWSSFTSPAGDFTVDVAGPVADSDDVLKTASRTYSWNSLTLTGSVIVVELTPSIVGDIPREAIYSIVQNQLISERDNRFPRARNRGLKQKTTPEFHEFEMNLMMEQLRCRLVVSGGRLYILKVVNRDPLFQMHGSLTDRFFDSFRINTVIDAMPEVEPITTYQKRFKNLQKKITKPMAAPQDWKLQFAPPGVEEVKYRSGQFDLPAWLAIPPGKEQQKNPAYVYLHGGNAFDILDYEFCKPALDAGFVVMVPMFRGENGNPGQYEALLGEADDAASAVQWLSRHDAVDPEKIYVFGHDFGGGIAGLLSLRDDVPIRHTGSCAGLYHDLSFYSWSLGEILPFPLGDKNERDLRLLTANLADMRRPHLAYVGKDDFNQLFLITAKRKIKELQVKRPDQSPMLQFEEIPGDHVSSLEEAIRRYVEFMKSDVGPNPQQPRPPKPQFDPQKKVIEL
ncbi:MAG: alpha/beta hydrolase family protein, partial [Planctomycetaceae bacterium]